MSRTPKSPSHRDCTYQVRWSSEEDAYIASCLQWRDQEWIAASPEIALRGIMQLVSESRREAQP